MNNRTANQKPAGQPAKAPPYPKVKYNDDKFRDIIPTLPLMECLKVEYRAKGVWFKMISKRGSSHNCECCGVINVGVTPIIDHIRGKKHRVALLAADKLFHPQYTAPRPTKSPARTPLLDEFLSNENNQNDKPAPAKPKPGPASATQNAKPGPASAQKPGTASASASKPGPASAQKPTSAQKPGPASQKQNQEANPQAKKPGPASSKKPINATNANKSTSEDKGNASTAVSKPNETDSKSKETSSDNSKVQSNTQQSNNNKSQPELEIVVLDDDDDDDIPPPQKPSDTYKVQNNSSQNNVGQAIPVAGTAIPKAQRPPKRSLNAKPMVQQEQKLDNFATKGENTIASGNKVLNPAAVLAQSGEKENENKAPRYQQNRVIIPTANKKKDLQTNKIQGGHQPSFSTKTFTPNVKSGQSEGIIGVEYVVKILKVYNDPEPFYECCLCEVVMDGIGMQTHLLGYNHRYKFIEKHFPTCFNQFKEHIGNIQVMGIILDRIAKAIESHHGRELPYECLSGEFRSNRHGVMTTVYSFRHASEYSGPSFTNVVDAKQVDELYMNKVPYNPPKPDPKRKPTFDTRDGGPVAKKGRIDRDREREHERDRQFAPTSGRGMNAHGDVGGPPSNRRPYRGEEQQVTNQPVDDATHKLMVEEFLQHTRGRSRSPAGRRRRHRSRSRSPHRSHRRESRRSPSPLREGDVWQAYRHLVDRSKNELDQMYREYRKDPEKHPVYDEEWRKFWKHRKEQLAREGLDHRNYDFQPEWVRYFAVRIEELYDESVEDIKLSARRRLILPMTNSELQDKKYHIKTVVKEPSDEMQKMEQHSKLDHPSFPDSTEKTSVVSVLRLLTALEDYLGSLGPKVVDMLSRALLVEKTNPREINEIILNLENCTILETAMEKLKGVLLAGLLEGPKVRAFNNVITETDKILRIAYKIRRDNPQPEISRPNPQPVPAPKAQQQDVQRKSFSPPRNAGNLGGTGSGNNTGAAANLLSQIDKKELATKLAAALTAQGKTDFNPEQLQQLIAVYSLIDKKKRDSAAATDKQKMTLSDTLTALLNPSAKGGDNAGPQPLLSNRMGGGGNYSNNNDKFGSMGNSSIGNLVNLLNRDSNSAGGNGRGADSEMWQNLQNIQSSLRSQNNMSANAGSGFGNNSANVGRGFGGGSGFNSGQNFNRGGNQGGGDSFEAGYRSGFTGMNNSNPSRMGGNDDMISGGRGVNDMMSGGNDMMGSGGRGGNDMISRGRNSMMAGGKSGNDMGIGGQMSSSYSSGGIGNFSRGGISGMGGANNTLGYARTSFLSGSGTGNSSYSNFPGLSNFSTSIALDTGKSTFQRSSLGGLGGTGGNSGSNIGGGSFNRGSSSFSNFSNQPNKNISAGGSTFGSAPNQRNMGGNQGLNTNNQANRSGSNWRNQ